jgi:hypothetical protein
VLCGESLLHGGAAAQMTLDPHRKADVHYLWAKGLGLLLQRAPGERLPCDGLTSMFFPATGVGRGGAQLKRDVERAIAICHTCPRMAECHRLADERKERDGVWGGEWFYRRHGLGRYERNGRDQRKHGTAGGYNRHLTLGTRPCDECREAKLRYRYRQRRTG